MPILVLSAAKDLESIVASVSGRASPVRAASLSEARARLRGAAPQLVVIDQAASGSGADPVQAVREVWSATKIILIASEAEPTDALIALGQSVFAYFVRPLLPDQFRKAVESALIQSDWEDGIEVISARPEWLTLRLRCQRFTVERLLAFLRQLRSDLSEDEREDIGEAVREILFNAIEHGGGLDPEQVVEVTRIRTPRMILYCIRDPGPGFSFSDLPHAALSNDPLDPIAHMRVREERGLRPGGFGILLTQSRVDEILYNEKGNEVVMVKYLVSRTEVDPGDRT